MKRLFIKSLNTFLPLTHHSDLLSYGFLLFGNVVFYPLQSETKCVFDDHHQNLFWDEPHIHLTCIYLYQIYQRYLSSFQKQCHLMYSINACRLLNFFLFTFVYQRRYSINSVTGSRPPLRCSHSLRRSKCEKKKTTTTVTRSKTKTLHETFAHYADNLI